MQLNSSWCPSACDTPGDLNSMKNKLIRVKTNNGNSYIALVGDLEASGLNDGNRPVIVIVACSGSAHPVHRPGHVWRGNLDRSIWTPATPQDVVTLKMEC